MDKQPGLPVRVAGPARRDIAAALRWSRREFGEAAALRYEALIFQALRDIGEDPQRPGSAERPEIRKDARVYHLYYSRKTTDRPGVKEPRHFVLYRRRDDAIEAARLLHQTRYSSIKHKQLLRRWPPGTKRRNCTLRTVGKPSTALFGCPENVRLWDRR